MAMRLGRGVTVRSMSMVVHVIVRVLVLRVPMIDRECLALVQHGRQAS